MAEPFETPSLGVAPPRNQSLPSSDQTTDQDGARKKHHAPHVSDTVIDWMVRDDRGPLNQPFSALRPVFVGVANFIPPNSPPNEWTLRACCGHLSEQVFPPFFLDPVGILFLEQEFCIRLLHLPSLHLARTLNPPTGNLFRHEFPHGQRGLSPPCHKSSPLPLDGFCFCLHIPRRLYRFCQPGLPPPPPITYGICSFLFRQIPLLTCFFSPLN